MNDPLLGHKLRSILAALRADIKPQLEPGNAMLRCELVEMMLSRLAVESEARDGPPTGVAEERDWRDAHEEKVAAILSAPVTPAGSATELAISADTFSRWFVERDPSIEIANVTTMPGGRSKGTILLDCTDGRQLVIRLDFSTAVAGTSVTDEFPVIKAVHASGLRVPEPFWLETSPDAIGGRFIVFERLEGSSMGTLFSTIATPAFCCDFAAELARLHNLDIDELGLADDLIFGREDHPVRALAEDYERRYRASMTPEPLIDAAFAWLYGQLPHIGNERRLVHGDAGLHNTLGENDRLTGLLDWEFTHAGDPCEDLAYCHYLVSRVMPWEEFMAAYYQAGGPLASEARMNFFMVWRTLLLSILTGFARASYVNGTDRDLRIAAIGCNTFPKQLRDLANNLSKVMVA